MQTSKLFVTLLVFSCCTIITFSQIPKGEMPGVKEIKFKSAINNQDYVLYVKLPDSYNSDTAKRYPVMYATDGQWSFPLIMEINGGLLYDNLVPEIIYVGIAWPDNFFVNRIRDFFPTKTDEFPDAGGAEKFLSVIKLEIIKRIDFAYRTDKTNNGLYGTSAGGFFTLYTLFHEPILFTRYIATSPTLDYNDAAAFKFEKAFSEKTHTLNARLFISNGGYEEEFGPPTFKNFNDQLKASNYKGLEIEKMVIEKMGHKSADPYAIGRGLQFVFSNSDIIVDTLLLDKYAGHYEQGMTFIRIGNSLNVDMGGKIVRIHASTNESFYLTGANGKIEFFKDDKGKVAGFNFKTAAGTFSAKKLD